MKGFRKLKEGEIIEKGDMFKGMECFEEAWTRWHGDKYDGDIHYCFYRRLKAKPRKIKKRINLRMKIVGLVEKHIKLHSKSGSWVVACQVANEIVPYIQGAYRRRKRCSK